MPPTTFQQIILVKKSINKYKKQEEVCFPKGIVNRYFYEGTGQGTLFDATTQVGGS